MDESIEKKYVMSFLAALGVTADLISIFQFIFGSGSNQYWDTRWILNLFFIILLTGSSMWILTNAARSELGDVIIFLLSQIYFLIGSSSIFGLSMEIYKNGTNLKEFSGLLVLSNTFSVIGYIIYRYADVSYAKVRFSSYFYGLFTSIISIKLVDKYVISFQGFDLLQFSGELFALAIGTAWFVFLLYRSEQ
ncbi:hypothetical protein [Azospirillum argentinense]